MFNHQFPLSSIMLNHQPRKASSILGEKSREGPFINGMNMKVKVVQQCTTLCDPVDSPWNSPGQNTGVGSRSLLQGNLPNPGIEPRSPALHANSLPAEPQGKPKNTGVGRLSLLQGIFPTQELNWGLLHCRHII